jgi:tripartite-type tricarboxylate transporter receptor subunit TctC
MSDHCAATCWYAFLTPINAGLADATIKGRLGDLGGVPMRMSAAEFGKFIADETEKWGKVIKFAGIKPQ